MRWVKLDHHLQHFSTPLGKTTFEVQRPSQCQVTGTNQERRNI
jgi:hypothetical protein